MHILYLPCLPTLPEDVILDALKEHFEVDVPENIDDAVSLLRQQRKNNAYAYKACVIAQELGEHVGEIARMHHECPSIPLILLTHAKPISELRTRYLRLGADDCLPIRHVHPEELVETVLRRILTRSVSVEKSTLVIADLTLNFVTHAAVAHGQVAAFTHCEWRFLEELGLKFPTHATHQRLHEFSEAQDSNVVAVIMSRLRRKLKRIDSCVTVESFRGVGYRLLVQGCN